MSLYQPQLVLQGAKQTREVDPKHIVASELKDPICHSDECQIGSFSSEATICIRYRWVGEMGSSQYKSPHHVRAFRLDVTTSAEQ